MQPSAGCLLVAHPFAHLWAPGPVASALHRLAVVLLVEGPSIDMAEAQGVLLNHPLPLTVGRLHAGLGEEAPAAAAEGEQAQSLPGVRGSAEEEGITACSSSDSGSDAEGNDSEISFHIEGVGLLGVSVPGGGRVQADGWPEEDGSQALEEAADRALREQQFMQTVTQMTPLWASPVLPATLLCEEQSSVAQSPEAGLAVRVVLGLLPDPGVDARELSSSLQAAPMPHLAEACGGLNGARLVFAVAVRKSDDNGYWSIQFDEDQGAWCADIDAGTADELDDSALLELGAEDAEGHSSMLNMQTIATLIRDLNEMELDAATRVDKDADGQLVSCSMLLEAPLVDVVVHGACARELEEARTKRDLVKRLRSVACILDRWRLSVADMPQLGAASGKADTEHYASAGRLRRLQPSSSRWIRGCNRRLRSVVQQQASPREEDDNSDLLDLTEQLRHRIMFFMTRFRSAQAAGLSCLPPHPPGGYRQATWRAPAPRHRRRPDRPPGPAAASELHTWDAVSPPAGGEPLPQSSRPKARRSGSRIPARSPSAYGSGGAPRPPRRRGAEQGPAGARAEASPTSQTLVGLRDLPVSLGGYRAGNWCSSSGMYNISDAPLQLLLTGSSGCAVDAHIRMQGGPPVGLLRQRERILQLDQQAQAGTVPLSGLHAFSGCCSWSLRGAAPLHEELRQGAWMPVLAPSHVLQAAASLTRSGSHGAVPAAARGRLWALLMESLGGDFLALAPCGADVATNS